MRVSPEVGRVREYLVSLSTMLPPGKMLRRGEVGQMIPEGGERVKRLGREKGGIRR
jgi:hypothetical protein